MWEASNNRGRRRDAGIETTGDGSSKKVVSETGASGERNRGWALINFSCPQDGR